MPIPRPGSHALCFIGEGSLPIGRSATEAAFSTVWAAGKRAMFERLERRQLLSADLQDGVLNVTGTDGNDNIRLGITGDQIVVHEDSGDTSFASSDVKSIHIRAGGGDDHVQLDADVPAAGIVGVGGEDTLLGGGGGD